VQEEKKRKRRSEKCLQTKKQRGKRMTVTLCEGGVEGRCNMFQTGEREEKRVMPHWEGEGRRGKKGEVTIFKSRRDEMFCGRGAVKRS